MLNLSASDGGRGNTAECVGTHSAGGNGADIRIEFASKEMMAIAMAFWFPQLCGYLYGWYGAHCSVVQRAAAIGPSASAMEMKDWRWYFGASQSDVELETKQIGNASYLFSYVDRNGDDRWIVRPARGKDRMAR